MPLAIHSVHYISPARIYITFNRQSTMTSRVRTVLVNKKAFIFFSLFLIPLQVSRNIFINIDLLTWDDKHCIKIIFLIVALLFLEHFFYFNFSFSACKLAQLSPNRNPHYNTCAVCSSLKACRSGIMKVGKLVARKVEGERAWDV